MKSIDINKKKKECLDIFADSDNACWEKVIKVVAHYPFENVRLATQIAKKHNIDFSNDDYF